MVDTKTSIDPTGQSQRPFQALMAGLAGVALVGLVDLVTGTEISMSIFYLLPVGLVTWFGSYAAGLCVAVAAGVTWLGLDLFSGITFSNRGIPYWNGAVRLGFFLVTCVLLHKIRILTGNLDALVEERTAQLQAEIARREALEREAVEMSRREQERIANELHDQFGGCLGGLAFRLKSLAEKLERAGRPEAGDARDFVVTVNELMKQVRAFARLLSPMDGTSFAQALSQLGLEMERVFGTRCLVDIAADIPILTDHQTEHLYRITQEAVRNAIQHAAAKQVDISLAQQDGQLLLTIQNDGKPWNVPAEPAQGLGLRIMRHRCGILGGTLHIQPQVPTGTCLTCKVPNRRDLSPQT